MPEKSKILLCNSGNFPGITNRHKICYDYGNLIHKMQRCVMGIIESAKLAKREINNNQELIEKQIETLKVVYEHHAISEAEFNRSIQVLKERLLVLAS